MLEEDIYLLPRGNSRKAVPAAGLSPLGTGRLGPFCCLGANASAVSVIGDWNGWDGGAAPLAPRTDGSGIWEGRVQGVQHGHAYKYRIVSREGGRVLEKADPVGFFGESAPATASRAWDLNYMWQDGTWMGTRAARNGLDAAMAIYEVHLGSWRRRDGAFLNYRELAHAWPNTSVNWDSRTLS